MNVRIAVFGEGPHEVGGLLGQELCFGDLPALPGLLHRMLRGPGSARYVAYSTLKALPAKRRDLRHAGAGPGGVFPTWAQKVQGAILQAWGAGCKGVVFVRDRDRKPDAERVLPMKQGRDALAHVAKLPPCAVGTPVETFDAWMIGDRSAVREVAPDASKCHDSPESLAGREGTGRHPKDWAAKLFGSGKGLGQKYAIVARHVDLEMLKKRCPEGFEPFAREVEERIRPLFVDS